MNVSVVGLGKVGACLAAVLAYRGHNVIGVDTNADTVKRIEAGEAPVEETGLQELLTDVRVRLTATTNMAAAISDTDISLVIVPTPSTDDGRFSNAHVLAAVGAIGTALREKDGYHLVVVNSTVMPGSMDSTIRAALEHTSLRQVGDEKLGLVYCVDDETEILTKRGWLRFNEVAVDDETLGINPATGQSEWQAITRVFRDHRETEMVLMEGKSHSSLTTPNHRWLVKNQRRQFEWRTTETLYQTDRIPIAAPRGDAPTAPTYDDDFVELVGWFWTEGTKSLSQICSIAQSEKANPDYVKRIRECLTRLYGRSGALRGTRWSPDNGGPRWREQPANDRGVVYFYLSSPVRAALHEVAPDGVLSPAFLLSLTKGQLELLIDVSVDADGHREAGSGRTRLTQAGRGCEERVGGFAFACALAGVATRTTWQHSNSWRSSRLCVALLRRDVVIPGLAAKIAADTGSASCGIQRVPYVGTVWCPTVKHGNWLARRRGRVYFTGNSPFLIALGSVIENLLRPDVVLVGLSDAEAGVRFTELWCDVVEAGSCWRIMELVNAEIAKLALNVALTAKMSYANVLAEVCERIPGADAQVVADAVGADSRIGRKYLTPATAWAGPCFPRDTRAFATLGSPMLPEMIDAVNWRQRERLVAKVKAHNPQRVAVLGIAYKPNTSVTDESAGLYVAAAFDNVSVYDPQATCVFSHVTTASSAAECVGDADVVVIATPWPEFADIELEGQHVIDCWGLLEHRSLPNYERVGRHDGHVPAAR